MDPVCVCLENDYLRLVVDDSAIVRELVNKKTGAALVPPGGQATGWKMVSNLGPWREHPLFDKDNHGQVSQSAGGVKIVFDGVAGSKEKLDFKVEISYGLRGAEAVAKIAVANNSSETLREIWFPFISGIGDLEAGEAHHMAVNYSTGIIMDDPLKNLPAYDGVTFGNRPGGQFFTRGFGKYPLMYPGIASMPWMDYHTKDQGWYLGYHDMATPSVSLLMRARSQEGDMQLGFARYPMIAPGESWESGEFVINCHEGDWHAGSKRYAAFAAGKIGQCAAPGWLSGAPGFHLISCIGQDRKINHGYEYIYETFKTDRAAGVDLPLLVFGWVKRGFDNGYPELDPDERVGGAAKLKEVIGRVQAEGGKVMLYSQGRLIDLCTDFYATVGRECCLKSEDGSPYIDEYSFNTESVLYPNRVFALGCPSSKQWEDQLKKQIDIVMGLGANGVLFDQIGADLSYICFDKSHGHAPDMAFHGKIAMLQSLQDYAASKDEGFAIIGELICDAFLQKLDITHGWETQDDETVPRHMRVRPEIYRYTFPDHRPSSRNCRSKDEYNRAFINGLVLEHYNKPGNPGLTAYVCELQKLRGGLMGFFNESKFADCDGLLCQPSHCAAKVYVGANGEPQGVALANFSNESATARIKLGCVSGPATLHKIGGQCVGAELKNGEAVVGIAGKEAAFLLLGQY